MRLRVHHTTHYDYPAPARDSFNEVRLMPLSDADQACLDFRLRLEPPAEVFAYDLPTGRVHHFNHRAPHDSLTIDAESLVVTHTGNPFRGLNLVADDMAFYQSEALRQKHIEYLLPTARVPLPPDTDRIAAVARKQADRGAASFLIALNRLMHRVFTYKPGATDVNTSILHVLEHKQGVCQDFAHLMLAIVRRQGIPARYVSGYLFTGDKAGEHLISNDQMHAWVECLLPDGRWRGFDPTNNLLTNDHYVKVHVGRDYGDVSPVSGVYRGPRASNLSVSVRVVRAEV